MENNTQRELTATAKMVRKDVIRMIGIARSGHLASSLSIVDILTVLYWDVMNVDPEEPRKPGRDRFILSKGHGCPALYSVLARRGFFNREELWNYRRLGAMLQGHPETPRTPGIDAPSGSLGMGLGMANGMALYLKRENIDSTVYCLAGDGEIQEGSIWESAMTSSHNGLDNIVFIVDRNRIQSEGTTSLIKDMISLESRLNSFGWDVLKLDGHDITALSKGLRSKSSGCPRAVIASTLPGKGVSFLEGLPERERPSLTRVNIDRALRELNGEEERGEKF